MTHNRDHRRSPKGSKGARRSFGNDVAEIGARPNQVSPVRQETESRMVSTWDKAAGEGKAPAPFLEEKFSLLHQYLSSERDRWTLVRLRIKRAGR